MANYILNHSGAQVDNKLADVANKAPINSPALTGTPTAPTPTYGDSSDRIATTAFVMAAISGTIRITIDSNDELLVFSV